MPQVCNARAHEFCTLYLEQGRVDILCALHGLQELFDRGFEHLIRRRVEQLCYRSIRNVAQDRANVPATERDRGRASGRVN